MTDTAKAILEKYQVRKSRKQKTAFIEHMTSFATRLGYDLKIEKGSLGARNIVIGEPDKADVVFTAHYDTCAVMPVPNFITPKNVSIYLLYQIMLVIGIFVVAGFLGVLLGSAASFIGLAKELSAFISVLVVYGMLFLMIAGPANKHTVNDNTSGVITLMEIMEDMPLESRQKVAFVFFDLEEAGLFGSSGFASKHKKAMKNKLLINFDCVSDGENIIFAVRKKAKSFVPLIEGSYFGNEACRTEVLTKGVFYPSDQMNFPCGVGVAALKRSKHFGILYMDRIHTKRDVIYREENIEFLKNASLKLVNSINKEI